MSSFILLNYTNYKHILGTVECLQNEGDKRQLGLFFFKESDAQALIDKVGISTGHANMIDCSIWPVHTCCDADSRTESSAGEAVTGAGSRNGSSVQLQQWRLRTRHRWSCLQIHARCCRGQGSNAGRCRQEQFYTACCKSMSTALKTLMVCLCQPSCVHMGPVLQVSKILIPQSNTSA